MAKISLTVDMDTDSGEMDVTLNGKKVPNASGVSAYTMTDYEGDPKCTCNILCSEQDEEAGIVKNTQYYSMSSAEAKRIDKTDAKFDIPGFIGQLQVDPTQAIAKFLTK